LPAGDGASAQHTNTLVVERVPFASQIGDLEEGEFFVGREMEVRFQGAE
jgi:hypothetical protein